MAIKLYDLAMADPDVRISPFCWIAKLALKHRGVDFETVPLRFAEKENYPGAENKTVPIIVDGDKVVCGSGEIIAYLEANYDGPAFYASEGERAAQAFYSAWVGSSVFGALAPALMVKVWGIAHEDDRDYFRSVREKRFGVTLEEFARTPGLKEKTDAALATLTPPLTRMPFLGGQSANVCDYTVFAPFLWRRIVTGDTGFDGPGPVTAWYERMLDLYGGYTRNAKTAA